MNRRKAALATGWTPAGGAFGVRYTLNMLRANGNAPLRMLASVGTTPLTSPISEFAARPGLVFLRPTDM